MSRVETGESRTRQRSDVAIAKVWAPAYWTLASVTIAAVDEATEAAA
jgi:hypothetical protein